MVKFIKLIRQGFYLFLDVSGSLLGIFLIVVGWWMKNGKPISGNWSWVIMVLGVCALLIHASHYLIAKKYGSNYFRTTRKP